MGVPTHPNIPVKDLFYRDLRTSQSAGVTSFNDALRALTGVNTPAVSPRDWGDTMSPLRWTCKSTRVLSDELQDQGFVISSTKVGGLLKSQGYSLQSGRKTIEGK